MYNFVREVVDLVEAKAHHNPVEFPKKRTLLGVNKSVSVIDGKEVPDPFRIIVGMSGEWGNYPTFTSLLQVIEHDPFHQAFFLHHTAMHFRQSATAILENFIEDYFDEALALHPNYWNDGIFNKLYHCFEKSIDSGIQSISLWFPLYNFQCKTERKEITINTHLRMTQPDTTLQRKFANTFALSFDGSWILLQDWFVKRDLGQTIATMNPSFDEQPELNALLLALRLIGGGNAKIHEAIILNTPGEIRQYKNTVVQKTVLGTQKIGNPTRFDTTDLATVQHYYKRIKDYNKTNPISLSRFAMTNERTQSSDIIIDSVIALENLLLAGEKQENRFKFAIRGAWLLEPGDISKREEVFNKLKSLYDRRSDLVHGSQWGDKKMSQKQVAEIADMELRRVLRKWLDYKGQQKSWEDFMRNLPLGSGSETDLTCEDNPIQ
jgi:hypothetical protein